MTTEQQKRVHLGRARVRQTAGIAEVVLEVRLAHTVEVFHVLVKTVVHGRLQLVRRAGCKRPGSRTATNESTKTKNVTILGAKRPVITPKPISTPPE